MCYNIFDLYKLFIMGDFKMTEVFNETNEKLKEIDELPDLIKFKQIALKYNYKLNNYKDIKDLIKEVYKNVQETKKET